MILSRWPLSDYDFMRFSLNGHIHQVLYGDGLTGAGVGLVVVQLPNGMKVALGVSHYHAEYNRQNDDFIGDRAAESFEAVEWIDMTAKQLGVDAIIYAGDFNTESGDLPHQ